MSDDRPPFFDTWRRVYAAVLVYAALLIALFAIFTKVFNG